ncbi:UNVERIFIED_CONTAM: hypothetical protein FKN15_042093 [Acipenser sinensis]
MAADSDGEFHSGTWEEKTEEISFADYKFTVTHHYLKEESPDGEEKEEPEEDAFPAAMQDLLCMNNDFPPRAHCLVRWYGVREFVVISPGANNDAIISESKCNLLLSSVSIALGNTGSQVPLFVQIQQKWRRMYAGECQGPGVRTDFEMVHLRKVPNQYNHLSGLLDIFKSKIGCPLTPIPPINIAIRFTYILHDWQQYSWPQQPPGMAFYQGTVLFPAFYLIDYMVHSARKRMRRHRRVEESPLSNEVLNSILLYLFSDAAEKPSNGSEAKPGASNANRPPEKEPENYNLYNQFKSSPADSLTYKLSLCLCMVNFYHGGVKGVVQLWQEFVLEMRYRWENNYLVPGLASGPPDLRCCLLHQKLQEPAPMTEDLLEEQSEVLAKLGTSAEGAHLRARMQSACLLSDMESFKEIINQIMAVETIIARARSLKAKFGISKCENIDEREELERFVNSLLEEPEVSVVGAGRGPAGNIIHNLFVNAQRAALMTLMDEESVKSGSQEERRQNPGAVSDFPPPAGREIILRTVVPRPAPYSKPLPQRMFCVLMKEDFRLAGAFSSDTSFF